MKEETNHILISNTEGYCTGCGATLIKMLWSNEIKYDLKTGQPYNEFGFICPKYVEESKIKKLTHIE